MNKNIFRMAAVSSLLLLSTQIVFAGETALGFGSERCHAWINAQNGGETDAKKFAMEEWFLDYLNAFSAIKGISFDGLPPDAAINMMTAACKTMPNEIVSTVAHASVNILEKRVKQRGG